MHLKSEADIEAALGKHGGVKKERKEALLNTIRSCRPEKLGDLHTVFTSEGALNKAELSFYRDLVVVEGNEGETPEIVQGAPGAPADVVNAAAGKK